MRRHVAHKIFSSVIVMLLSIISWGQTKSHKMPEPQMVTSSGTPPPPPGLPIDFGVPALIAGGLALGIYFLRPKNRI